MKSTSIERVVERDYTRRAAVGWANSQGNSLRDRQHQPGQPSGRLGEQPARAPWRRKITEVPDRGQASQPPGEPAQQVSFHPVRVNDISPHPPRQIGETDRRRYTSRQECQRSQRGLRKSVATGVPDSSRRLHPESRDTKGGKTILERSAAKQRHG
jgi:hypothetical protein